MFLVGRCGCRLKNENPGWDLLLNVDWEKALLAAGQPEIAAPVSSPEAVVIKSQIDLSELTDQSEASSVASRRRPLLIASAGLFLAAIVAFFLFRGGQKSA